MYLPVHVLMFPKDSSPWGKFSTESSSPWFYDCRDCASISCHVWYGITDNEGQANKGHLSSTLNSRHNGYPNERCNQVIIVK